MDLDGNLMGCAAVSALLCMASAPHSVAACMRRMQHHKTASTLDLPVKAYSCHLLAHLQQLPLAALDGLRSASARWLAQCDC